MINGQMTNYIMPTSLDVPPIRVIFEEVPYGLGPSGAKGIGELPLDGTAPAVANAIAHATGVGNYSHAGHAGSTDGNAGAAFMPERDGFGKVRIRCVVNGKPLDFEAYPMARLLDVLREELRLTGTKEGCGEGECGACCRRNRWRTGEQLSRSRAAGWMARKIRTIEGIAEAGRLDAVQQSFLEHGGAQCGICTPGMILAAMNLLERCPAPHRSPGPRRPCRKSVPLHGLHENFRVGA